MRTECSPFWTKTNHKDFLKEIVQILSESRSFMWNSWYLIKDPPSLLKDQQADMIAKPCRFPYAFRITLYNHHLRSDFYFLLHFASLSLIFVECQCFFFFSTRTIWAFFSPFFCLFFMKSCNYRHPCETDANNFVSSFLDNINPSNITFDSLVCPKFSFHDARKVMFIICKGTWYYLLYCL